LAGLGRLRSRKRKRTARGPRNSARKKRWQLGLRERQEKGDERKPSQRESGGRNNDKGRNIEEGERGGENS